MQIETNCGFIFIDAIVVVQCNGLGYGNAVAIIVMACIVAPKWNSPRRHIKVIGVAGNIRFVPIDLTCSAIDIKHRCNQRNNIVSNIREGFPCFDGKSVR